MSKEIEITWATCPRCGPRRRAEIVARYTDVDALNGVEGVDWQFSYYYDVLKCRGCEHVFFGTSNSEPDLFGPGEFFPKHELRKKPTWMSASARGLNFNDLPDWYDRLDDFYGCLNSGLFVPAAVAARTAFESVLTELGVSGDISFAKKLDLLSEQGHISVKERDELNVLVEGGHAAVHRGWRPTEEELSTIAAILESFIERTFIRFEKAAKILDRIPVRPRRKKGLKG